MIDDVLQAVEARLSALGLAWGGSPIPVSRGKVPRQGEGESAATQFMVSAATRPKDVRRFTNLHDLHTYEVRIAFWTPGNRDNETNLDALSAAEDAVARAFSRKPADLMGLDGLRDVSCRTAAFVPVRYTFTPRFSALRKVPCMVRAAVESSTGTALKSTMKAL